MDDLDACVRARPAGPGRAARAGPWSVIGQAEFPLVVGLGHDRVHHQAQVFLRRVVDRDHQADDGLVREVHPLDPHPGQVRLGRGPPGQPVRVFRIEIPSIGPGMGVESERADQLHLAAVAAPDANDQGVLSLRQPLEVDLPDEAGVVGIRELGMRRLDVEAHGAVRDPLAGKAVDEDPDVLDAGLRQGPAPDPQMSGTDAHRIRPGHVANRQDGAGLRGGWGRRRRDRPGGARLQERRGRLFVSPGRWSIQIALQVGDRLHHLGHRLDQLPMPAQALPVGERGAFLLSGQGRLPGRAVRLQRPVQLAAQLLGELAVGRGRPILLIGELP